MRRFLELPERRGRIKMLLGLGWPKFSGAENPYAGRRWADIRRRQGWVHAGRRFRRTLS